MQASHPVLGKRERNKRHKLQRIIDAATELFEERGIDHVTIDDIARQAGIGKGTLFLYAPTKGDLVLLVQNAHYAAAVDRAAQHAARATTPFSAVSAVVREVVTCNRFRVDNGRNYLHGILFGSVADPHRRRALEIVDDANRVIAQALRNDDAHSGADAMERAEIISDIMFVTLAITENAERTDEEVVADILRKSAHLIPPSSGDIRLRRHAD